MNHLAGVPRTLLITLRARAAETQRPDPLVSDPFAAAWYQQMPRFEDLDRWYNPAAELAIVIRAHLMDLATRDFLAANPGGWVVELGAGLTTRRTRIGAGRWLLVDFPEVTQLLRQFDPPGEGHRIVTGDLTEYDWIDAVPVKKPLLFLAEGVLPFLAPADVDELLRRLATRFPAARIVFDTIRPRHLVPMNEGFVPLGAPLLWGASESDLRRYPLSVEEIRYLYLEQPARWEVLGLVPLAERTVENSSLVVTARLQPASEVGLQPSPPEDPHP
jgi:O-methyltransferase involved in polyketide biosynthesis